MFLGRRFFIIFFIYHRSFPVVQNNARDYTFGALFGTTWVTFWHHLGDFGRHFGTSWAPRGSQNRPFWPQVAPKTQKMSPRMRHQKMYENLIEIWWKKWRFWMCSSHRTIMYKGILVVGAFYEEIKNLMKKWCQKGPKIDAKIDIWAIRGPTFEVLGHVFGQTFFNNF